MSDDRSLQTEQSDWRTRTLLAGGIIGSLIGVSAAYLYLRAAEEASEDGSPRSLATPEAVKLGMSLLALVRQIADMGGKN